jgi:hypothetical protein
VTTTAPTSYPDWEYQVLSGLGITKPKPAALQALSLWAQSEGTNPASYNWLATSLKGSAYPEAGTIATNGGNAIPAYANQSVGVAATVATLKQYPAIVNALGNAAGLQGIWLTINDSSWCKGCQSGLYPVALAQAVNAGGGTAAPGNTTPSSAPNAGDCLLQLSVIGCVLNRSQAKALVGGMMVVMGVGGLALGGILAVAFGLAGSRTGRQATNLAAKVPVVGAPARGLKAVTSSGGRPRASRSGAAPQPSSPGPVEPAGAHAAAGRHAPGRTGGVSAREVVRNANRDEDDRQRALRAAGAAQDRRNATARRQGAVVSES